MTFAQIFDIGAACVVAFFVVRGILRGLTGEIMSLLGLVASVVCSWTFSRSLADMILFHFPNWDRVILEIIYRNEAEYYTGGGWSRTVLELGCSIALFVAVSLVFAIAAKILRSVIKAADLTFWDHFLGAFLGAARALFMALLIYGGVTLFSSVIPSEWMRESAAMRITAVAWPPVLKVLREAGWIRSDGVVTDAVEIPSLNALPSLRNAIPSLNSDLSPLSPGFSSGSFSQDVRYIPSPDVRTAP
jgi:uncharacterized membrane protein required for colicin V production